jgi:isopentenyl phosphate kinase
MSTNKSIILVKLGGSVITDKNVSYFAREDVIKRLAEELKNAKTALVIAHGSGSFGHVSAAKYGGAKGYKSTLGLAKVALDALEINRIVMRNLVAKGLPAISFKPMSMITAKNGEMKNNFFEPIILALKQELIPVVYGDGILDETWKSTIFSGETSLGKIALYLKSKGYKIAKIIEVGETDGVYDDKKNTIFNISSKSWPKIKKFIFNSNRADVTGGMKHKIEEALKISQIGTETLIINGNIKNELARALSGKPTKGTVIR